MDLSKFTEQGIEIKDLARIKQKVLCPKCSHTRKKKNDPCLFVDLETKKWFCHNCNWRSADIIEHNQYTRPDPKLYKKPTEKHYEFMSNRGINKETCDYFGIFTAKKLDCICYPYRKWGQMVNIKHRTQDKKFFQSKNAERVIFNFDGCLGEDIIYFFEGEDDAMIAYQVGFNASTSVDQGAPQPSDRDTDKKLACLDNSFDVLGNASEIIIAVDSDAPGRRLRDELIRRYGAEICKIVEWPSDCKDARDVFLKYGEDKLKECLSNPKLIEPDGIFVLDNTKSSLILYYDNGLEKGETTHYPEIDNHFTWKKSFVNVWSGYNNEGKSTMLLQLSIIKSVYDAWKHAFFTPESLPIDDFYIDAIEMYTGKTADKDYPNHRMTKSEYMDAMYFLNKHLFIINPEEYYLKNILEIASFLIKTQGIRTLNIDPFNAIWREALPGESRDHTVMRFMDELKRFAVNKNIIVNLVAHQVTPETSSDNYPAPNKYRIREGGSIADKADCVIAIWREYMKSNPTDTRVWFISQKVKKQKLVGIPGQIEMDYNFKQSRYYVNGFNPLTDFNKLKSQINNHDKFFEIQEGEIDSDRIPF